ncbi:hypothetical protein ACHAWF_004769 [Thalassiosira exigua]
MSRASEALASVPLATRFALATIAIAYGYQLLLDPPLRDYTMCPRSVLYEREFYRVVTSALFHANLMHVGMNGMSTAAIGGMLEKRIGSLMTALTIAWGILLTSATYLLVSWLLYAALGYEKMMLQHSVGFSGVVFQLSALESNLGPDRTRSVFGLFQVSSKLYPWALLVVLQVIMPQISFLGHLSGILVGTLQYYGALDVLFPSEARLREWEASDRFEVLRTQPGYASVPEEGFRREPGDARAALSAGLGGVCLFVANVCETIKVCIFGRGAEANANIQLGELSAAWGSGDVDASTGGAGALQSAEDDEEWVGLPAAIQRSTEEM